MAAILSNLRNAVILSIVLSIVLISWAAQSGASPSGVELGLMRFLHVVCGVMWIGLLWYFNFVQTPSRARIADAEKPAVTRVIAPTALFWFRHAALWTVITGLTLSTMNGSIGALFTFERPNTAIAIGMWFALIMAFNVWFIIWPNQKRALGLVSAEPEAKARSARIAGTVSRLNTMFSIPMLYCMVAQQHGGL